LLVFHHPDHRCHDPRLPHLFGGVPAPPAETAARAERILSGLAEVAGFRLRRPGPLDPALLERVHRLDYLEFLAGAHERWRTETGAPPDGEAVPYIRPIPGTPWREPESVLAQLGRYSNDVDPILAGTWQGAVASAACAVAAAEAVLTGEPSAYGLCRPPGHHAGPANFGGYCYLNNAALAAIRLAEEAARVAVLDLDTHHGNGTQTIFWDDPTVLTVSIHGDPDRTYPYFLGYPDEHGGPGAAGSNLNLALPLGTGWEGYDDALAEAIGAIRRFQPDGLVVALGVDTHVDHGVLALAGHDFSRLGGAVAALGIPTVVVQEGGYAPGCLETAVPAFLAALAGG
jgi:acetoin utilization deacetylase AcuC-like enzyme